MEGIFTRTEDVNFPTPPKDEKVQTAFGIVVGEPEQSKLVALTNDQYEYLKTLTPLEKRRLPRRDDPALPSALDTHMKASKVYQYTEEDREM